MPWLNAALLAPALSAFGNYLDKYLVSGGERTGGVGSVILFSCAFSVLVLPVSFFLSTDVLAVPMAERVLLMLNGGLTVGALLAYLYSIEHSDVISVVPTLQTIPVFGFALGYLILGETLSGPQVIGSLVIIIGAVLLSMEIQANGHMRVRRRDLTLALTSSLLFALSGVVFKLIAVNQGFWVTEFWEYVGIAITGLCIFFINGAYRSKFLSVIQNSNIPVISLNFATELIMVTSDLLLNYATLLAQVALVYTVNSFQPAFLFVYGLLGAIVSPNNAMLPKIDSKLYLKGLVILLMICGAVLLYI